MLYEELVQRKSKRRKRAWLPRQQRCSWSRGSIQNTSPLSKIQAGAMILTFFEIFRILCFKIFEQSAEDRSLPALEIEISDE